MTKLSSNTVGILCCMCFVIVLCCDMLHVERYVHRIIDLCQITNVRSRITCINQTTYVSTFL